MSKVLFRAKPFLKWVGGKRWLVRNYSHIFPRQFCTYHEPFLGGGSVFFHMSPTRALLSDANPDLVLCYQALQEDWRAVWRHLKAFSLHHSDEFYYRIRSHRYRSREREAARFIYLNRTCFNGIYRENLFGEFNVPRGTKDSVIFPDDDFAAISKALKSAKVTNCDFAAVLKHARKGDFVFVDPPYTVRHNANGFVKYNQNIFSWADQIRLRDEVKSAAKRGGDLLDN